MKISHFLCMGAILVMTAPASAQVSKAAKAGAEVSKTLAQIQTSVARNIARMELSAVSQSAQAASQLMETISSCEKQPLVRNMADDDYYSNHSEGRYAVHTEQSLERFLERRRQGLGMFDHREYHAPPPVKKKAVTEDKKKVGINTDEQPVAAVEEEGQALPTDKTEQPKTPVASDPTQPETTSAPPNQ